MQPSFEEFEPNADLRPCFSGATRYSGEMRDDMPVSEDLIAEKYLNAETSGLEYEVTPSSRRFDFQVERP